MFKQPSFVAVVVFLAACGGGGGTTKKQSGSTIKSSAMSGKPAINQQKPASPMKATTPPKPIPAPKTAGAATVTPPNPTASGAEAETWAFTNVDVDGDGSGDSGVVLADSAGTTLLVWWSGSFTNEGGTTTAYEGLMWIVNDSVGFIIDFSGQAVLACAADASSSAGCVVCDAAGTCSESGTESAPKM